MNIATLLICLALQDKADDFLKFKKDTVWTYAEVEGKGRKETLRVLKYVSEDKGVATLEASSGSETQTMYWRVEDGLLCWAIKGEEKVDTVFRFVKIGSKKGDTWKVEDAEFEGEATHAGTADVKVPAGEYKGAIRVELKTKHGTMEIYLVPKVGVVLLDVKGDEPWRFELREFKEGK